MPYEITTDENGKLVILEKPKKVKGLVEGKERFIALQSNRHTYEVFDDESSACAYLLKSGGKVYRLTYYQHNGSNGIEQLPMSNLHKEVNGAISS